MCALLSFFAYFTCVSNKVEGARLSREAFNREAFIKFLRKGQGNCLKKGHVYLKHQSICQSKTIN